MSSLNNKFLNDFMQMRREMYQAPVVQPKKGGKKGVDSLKQAPKPEKEITLAYIIENKPSADKVTDYLKMRAEELIAQDED
jgi:hypothetical protein